MNSFKKMLPVCLSCLSCLTCLTYLILGARVCSAEQTSFDKDWKFIQKDVPGAQQASFSDAQWRALDLPHDWSVEGEFERNNPSTDRSGYLPTGVGWYRKTVTVPQSWRGKRVAIQFDGVFRNSTVWANGTKLGARPYGWISFEYDISEIAESADTITFAVKVDNKLQHAARWYTGSGIYAHTWINVREPVHIPTSGIWLRTAESTVTIDAEVCNATAADAECLVKTTILDADGKQVAAAETPLTIRPEKTDSVSQTIDIPTPNLWSPKTPYLYRAVSEVQLGSNPVDRVETRFGIRDIEWKPGTGMWLNGENLKLRGVCQHQHGGALGAAVNEKFMRFRVQQLKAMGCNAIRTAHNPHTPQFYDICDEIGMIVMDEFVDGWNRKARHDYGAHDFEQWWNRDLTDWIKRDRNHPSVFVWSVGNETHGDIAQQLVARCHELDKTRPVTSGSSESDFMDLYGMNGGSEAVGWFDNSMPKDRVFIGTENTHTWQTRGYYRTLTWYRDGKHSNVADIPDLTPEEIFTVDWTDNSRRSNRKQFFKSSYDNATVRSPARRAIAQIRDVPNNAGMFRWTGHDYLGEAGLASGAWPFKLFSGGAVDLANFEKDLYYLYQSQWTTEPMLHVLPHWTHPVMPAGTEIPVWVYSNCDEVELFLDDKSLGKQTPGLKWQEMQCQWMVGWKPGTLSAVGYRDGKRVAAETIRTADAPAKLKLSIDGAALAESGADFVQVRAAVVDGKDEPYPYGENRIWFDLSGPAKFRALDNGNPADVEPFYGTTDRNAFFGLARAYVESTTEAGDIALVAGSIMGDKKLFVSKKVHIDVRRIDLRGQSEAPQFEIFYTTDGSKPSNQSERYQGPFDAHPGTTVKAVATVDGVDVLQMEERFAADLGLVWTGGGLDTDFGGDQAEDAEFSQAKTSTDGKNYNGSGFLNMGKKKGSFVQWYQENDGDTAEVMLAVRYSGVPADGKPFNVRLNVNGEAFVQLLPLQPSRNSGKHWRTDQFAITLKRGANTIRLTTMDDRGPLIDEIEIRQ